MTNLFYYAKQNDLIRKTKTLGHLRPSKQNQPPFSHTSPLILSSSSTLSSVKPTYLHRHPMYPPLSLFQQSSMERALDGILPMPFPAPYKLHISCFRLEPGHVLSTITPLTSNTSNGPFLLVTIGQSLPTCDYFNIRCHSHPLSP